MLHGLATDELNVLVTRQLRIVIKSNDADFHFANASDSS
jgi:hypothetical protein